MNRSHLKAWVLTVSIVSALLCAQSSAAQVIPDATLPVGERSQVTGNPNMQIDGGARRGGNLFHSFSQFSIPTGGSAYFNNAADVRNIFSRVTGGSISNIDGVIRANGSANLFLLNPNGILFGANASLNIGGSFVATTANAIGFPNGEVFSSNTTQPLPSQLLNVNPNALFFNQLAAQGIINRSTANNGIGLQVPAGQSLLLVGGDVQLDGGQIVSPGSRVELGAVAGQGIVGLSETTGDWRLSFSDNVTRADISFSNSALIDVRAGGGGSITVTARNLSLSEGSRLRAGISDGLGFAGAQAGDIQLNATEAINLVDSVIDNEVRSGGTGNSGNINITTGSLFATRGAQLQAYTAGQGNTGNVNINVRDRVSFDGSNTAIFNDVEPDGVGNSGDINITTGSLSLTGEAELISYTAGQGNAGNVNINAYNTVSLSGYGSSIFNIVYPNNGVGNAGNINITTGSLSVTGGAQLISYTPGQGNAGNVNIDARDRVSFDGDDGTFTSSIFTQVVRGAVGQGGAVTIATGSLFLTNGGAVYTNNVGGTGNAGRVTIQARDSVQIRGVSPTLTDNRSGVFTTTAEGAVGGGGDVSITTGSLSVSDQGRINTNTQGQGNAGNITLAIRSLSLTGGAQLVSSTFGQGDAGSITINARDQVSLDGGSLDGAFASSIFSQVESSGVGRGGDLMITTGLLSLINGGALNTATNGRGNAGSVTIQARDSVQIRGTVPTNTFLRSGVFTTATQGSVGDGGDVTITTGSLSVSEQGQIITDVRSQGNAGNIQIQASDAVSFDRGDAISTLSEGGVGKGGNIDITGRSLSVLNNAQLSASTAGEGNAGNITVSADLVGVNSGGQLRTTTSSNNGQAGDITVNTPNLQLSGATSGLFADTTSAGAAGNLTIQPRGNEQSVRVNLQDGAQISASTSSSGRGGDLTIAAPESITLTGDGSIIAAGTGGSGDGGNLNLRTRNLNIQNQAEITVSSSGIGSAGNLFVDADRIFLNNQGSIRADTSGGGGNINLRSPLILLRNGSNITTNATGANIPGGNIGIDTRFLVAVPNEDSNISANSEDFRGGNVSINAFSIFGIQPSLVSTPLSDITATGATSALSGTTDVSTAGIDPTSGLVALPTDFVDRSGLIAQGCPANQGNSFAIGGRGGLPPTPEQQLDDDANWQDRRRLVANQQVDGGGEGDTKTASILNSQLSIPNSPPLPHTPIIEATGWLITPTGETSLVASTPDPTMQNRLKWSVVCSRRESSK